MKKIMLVAAGVALLVALIPAVTLAGPPSPPNYGTYNPTDQPFQPPEEAGVEKVIPSHSAPGGAVRIITDPLVGIDSAAKGWVTFWCQSKLGFQYNISVIDLDRLTRYSVKVSGARIFELVTEGTPGAFELEAPGSGIWVIAIVSVPVNLDLGTFKSDSNGQGGVNGVEKLQVGYVYNLTVEVFNGATKVMEPGEDPYYGGVDTNGIIVY